MRMQFTPINVKQLNLPVIAEPDAIKRAKEHGFPCMHEKQILRHANHCVNMDIVHIFVKESAGYTVGRQNLQ